MMKRILSFAIVLCMLLSVLPGTVLAVETTDSVVTEELVVEQMDASQVDVDLVGEDVQASDLVLEQSLVDENGMIEVFIEMEGESIIEEDAAAVMDAETQQKVEAMEEVQAEIVANIEETVLEGETLEVSYNYTWVFNGIAARVPYGTMADIAAVDGVKKVVVQPVYEMYASDVTPLGDASMMTISDGVMVGRENTWAEGYTGKGIKIAIIDSGIDTDHQNFQALAEDKLTADSATVDTVAAVLANLNASSRYKDLAVDNVYYSSKIAFGFNYADDSLNITHDDGKSDHGTHVAGIAAANKVDESNVVGVAPDAQLYVMKVFGTERSGYGSDIIAALEDALILGADVVNMSLGSDAGFTTSASEMVNEIYERVAQTNTVLSISAGNNYTSGLGNLWGTDANLTVNPDNAVIGEPGAYHNVLSVASVENWKIERNYIDAAGYQFGYVDSGAEYELPQIMTLTGEYGVVAVPGTGTPEDYEGLDVTGKVALVQRGVTSFVEKCENAQAAGAVACIIYNNTSGEFGMDLTDIAATIPCVSIAMADGTYLVAALEEDPDLKMSFPTELGSIPSELAYRMSDFSAWGVAPDLSLEPDITAPGGNIYSTLDGGKYGLMSGTSMAAPNVSGISALVMQYVKENFGEDTDYRTMVQNLLVSTSSPLTYDAENDLFYSPRSQGSGLANAYDAVVTKVYLSVDGTDSPKAELGDDHGKTGVYDFSFNVTNFGDTPAYYTLDTLAQTEDYVDYDGVYFMSSTPKALSAAAEETTDSMVLRYDVDNNEVCWSHDAYLIYRAAIGESEIEGWEDEAFRYDLNKDDAVAKDDVQAYLDELVGKEANVDLDEKVMRVAAGETAKVSVSLALTAEDKSYFDTYYPNGGYVEGFTFLTALNQNGVDLSLPYLGFYGDWAAAPVLDSASYWDYYAADYDGESILGNQYYHVVLTNFYGVPSYTVPGFNIYFGDEPFDMNHMAVSPNDDGYFDTIDDIHTSLLRNAATLTYRYTDMETGEVYYEQTVQNVSKSVYSSYDGMIIPSLYSMYEGEIELYDWKDAEGNDLANNTKLLLEVVATGVAGDDTPETWSVPITVDVEAPILLGAKKLMDLDSGEVTLEVTFKDNHAVALAGVMTSDGQEIIAEVNVDDPEPDAEGYRNYTVSFDVTGCDAKVMLALGDYVMNESYYGINIQGEGESYGEFIAFQDNFNTGIQGWVSFDENVDSDELTLFITEENFVCAEYVNGYVYAQTENGALYGFRYEDMLGDSELEPIYITQLDNVYQDLAYSYAEGKLLGMLTYVDGGYPTTEINTINLKGEYYDEDMWSTVYPYQEDWFINRGGIYGLGFTVDDAGNLYLMGCNYDWDTESVGKNAHLWVAPREVVESTWGSYVDYYFQDAGDTGMTMDYLQSMTWDHNSEKLYWARFDEVGLDLVSELIEVDASVGEDLSITFNGCTKVGTLSGETWALFAPMSEETAAKTEHSNLPTMDSTVVGTPILRDEVITMNLGGVEALAYDFDPWYTDHKEVTWSTSDAEVVSVDANGVITALSSGSATITVANKADETKFDTVEVNVTALDLKIEGILSTQGEGIGNTYNARPYTFEMVDGISTLTEYDSITASEEMNFGLALVTSEYARGSIWASEYGNTGMVYEIDADTGAVKDVFEPIAGDMMYGLTYNETMDTFTGIMNYYMYVDLPMDHAQEDEMRASYDEEQGAFMWHRVNLLPYLTEAGEGFLTGETGQGASSEVVFCGITAIDGGIKDSYGETRYYDTYKDYLGNWAYGGMCEYQPDQTLVLLDNVGRLWYINEVTGVTVETDEWGNVFMTTPDGGSIDASRNGVISYEYVNEDGTSTYSVFHITKIVETPLTDMFRAGTMPRITYHFSDIEFGGYTADGDPIYAMSLYDYWNNSATNELYLYVPGHETDEMDYETWEPICTPDRMFTLGNTGKHNIIASIHSLEVTGGLDPEEETTEESAPQAVNKLTAGAYGG